MCKFNCETEKGNKRVKSDNGWNESHYKNGRQSENQSKMNRSEEQTKRPPSMQCHCDSLHTCTVITSGVCVLSGGSSKDEVPHCFLFQGAGADGQLSQVCSCGAHLPAYTKVPTLQPCSCSTADTWYFNHLTWMQPFTPSFHWMDLRHFLEPSSIFWIFLDPKKPVWPIRPCIWQQAQSYCTLVV